MPDGGAPLDPNRFDALARALAAPHTRRRALRAGAGAALAALGLARGGPAAAGQDKKPLCHFTGSASNPWQVINVAEPAWQTHYDHGDHDYFNCCDDAACAIAGQTCGGGGVEGQCGAPALCQNVVCTPLDQCHDAGACDPATGLCSNPRKANSTPCSADNDACTLDTCQNGACIAGAPKDCTTDPELNDQCNTGVCNPATGTCEKTPKPEGTPCDDGNACTIDACAGGACAGTPIDCDDHNACTIDACDEESGCVHTEVDCDDFNACTLDSCDPDLGCVYTEIDCDGDPCTEMDCDDHDACTIDSCDEFTGCVHTPKVCDDGIVCTVDSCNPTTGCVHTPVADFCEIQRPVLRPPLRSHPRLRPRPEGLRRRQPLHHRHLRRRELRPHAPQPLHRQPPLHRRHLRPGRRRADLHVPKRVRPDQLRPPRLLPDRVVRPHPRLPHRASRRPVPRTPPRRFVPGPRMHR